MSFINKKCLQTCFLEPYSYNFGSLLGGGVAVCLFLSAHRAVIFAISQLSCFEFADTEQRLCLLRRRLISSAEACASLVPNLASCSITGDRMT